MSIAFAAIASSAAEGRVVLVYSRIHFARSLDHFCKGSDDGPTSPLAVHDGDAGRLELAVAVADGVHARRGEGGLARCPYAH